VKKGRIHGKIQKNATEDKMDYVEKTLDLACLNGEKLVEPTNRILFNYHFCPTKSVRFFASLRMTSF